MKLAFWLSAGLLVYAQVGYGVLLAALARLRPGLRGQAPQSGEPPTVCGIVCASRIQAEGLKPPH